MTEVFYWNWEALTSKDFEKIKLDLSLAERQITLNMSSGKRRSEFLASRHLLRRIVGGKFRQKIPDVLSYEDSGKPKNIGPLHLNWSHSFNSILLVVSSSTPVGADLERFRDRDFDVLLKKFASPSEIQSVVNARSPQDKCIEFYKLWCLKESFAKATGAGLAANIKDIEVDLKKSSIKNCTFPNVSFHTQVQDGFFCSICELTGELTHPKWFEFNPELPSPKPIGLQQSPRHWVVRSPRTQNE